MCSPNVLLFSPKILRQGSNFDQQILIKEGPISQKLCKKKYSVSKWGPKQVLLHDLKMQIYANFCYFSFQKFMTPQYTHPLPKKMPAP